MAFFPKKEQKKRKSLSQVSLGVLVSSCMDSQLSMAVSITSLVKHLGKKIEENDLSIRQYHKKQITLKGHAESIIYL